MFFLFFCFLPLHCTALTMTYRRLEPKGAYRRRRERNAKKANHPVLHLSNDWAWDVEVKGRTKFRVVHIIYS